MEGGCEIDTVTYKKALEVQEEAERLQQEVKRLAGEVEEVTRQLQFARDKLVEAQERNRKLEWLLVKAMEEL